MLPKIFCKLQKVVLDEVHKKKNQPHASLSLANAKLMRKRTWEVFKLEVANCDLKFFNLVNFWALNLFFSDL